MLVSLIVLALQLALVVPLLVGARLGRHHGIIVAGRAAGVQQRVQRLRDGRDSLLQQSDLLLGAKQAALSP